MLHAAWVNIFFHLTWIQLINFNIALLIMILLLFSITCHNFYCFKTLISIPCCIRRSNYRDSVIYPLLVNCVIALRDLSVKKWAEFPSQHNKKVIRFCEIGASYSVNFKFNFNFPHIWQAFAIWVSNLNANLYELFLRSIYVALNLNTVLYCTWLLARWEKFDCIK